MPDETPPSLQNDPTWQPVNPYEPSAEAGGVSPDTPGAATERHYQERFTWADRRMLLRSVFPARFIAVGFGLWAASAVYRGAVTTYSFFSLGLVSDPAGVVLALAGLCVLAVCLLSVYAAWLTWTYADRLQAIAGGATSSMLDWSALHFRLVRLLAICVAFVVSQRLLMWLYKYMESAYIDSLANP